MPDTPERIARQVREDIEEAERDIGHPLDNEAIENIVYENARALVPTAAPSLDNDTVAVIRQHVRQDTGGYNECMDDRRALLAHIDALTAAVRLAFTDTIQHYSLMVEPDDSAYMELDPEGRYVIDEEAESAVLAILRGDTETSGEVSG